MERTSVLINYRDRQTEKNSPVLFLFFSVLTRRLLVCSVLLFRKNKIDRQYDNKNESLQQKKERRRSCLFHIHSIYNRGRSFLLLTFLLLCD